MKRVSSRRKDIPSTALSRRSFLAAGSALGAAALGSPLVLRGADPKSTAANNRLNLAVVGCGGQGRGDMRQLIGCGANVVALCDPDAAQINAARKAGGKATNKSKAYEDYRKLLDDAATFDAVLVATPDHWHAALCKAFMKAGKHVYCEKPLTHSVSEAREVRELARATKVVTQMGNQGSASASLRRCVEIIRAGALGQIREIYHWGIGVTASEGSAPGEDAIPAGFNWDLWVGPSAMRPFKLHAYHPAVWRHWFDFGNGGLADFFCHAVNLPLRSLDLGYPERLVTNVIDGKQAPGKAAVEYHFPARGSLEPLTLYWQGEGLPPAEIIQPVVDAHKVNENGIIILGEKGCIYTGHWNNGGLIRLAGEQGLKDVLHHEATKDIPQSLRISIGTAKRWKPATPPRRPDSFTPPCGRNGFEPREKPVGCGQVLRRPTKNARTGGSSLRSTPRYELPVLGFDLLQGFRRGSAHGHALVVEQVRERGDRAPGFGSNPSKNAGSQKANPLVLVPQKFYEKGDGRRVMRAKFMLRRKLDHFLDADRKPGLGGVSAACFDRVWRVLRRTTHPLGLCLASAHVGCFPGGDCRFPALLAHALN
jgi:predicted dehydrogenase